jgi:hypothetical protein
MEYITADEDAWHCICGNKAVQDGFYPCDTKGDEMVPDVGSDWDGLYLCARCGRIINQATLEVVGHNPDPIFLE